MSSEANHQHPSTNIPAPRESLNPINGRKLALLSLLTIVAAIYTALFWGETANLFGIRRFFSSPARTAAIAKNSASDTMSASKTPVYFLSHGGVSTTSCPNEYVEYMLTICTAECDVRG